MATVFTYVKRVASVVLTCLSIVLVSIGVYEGYNIADFGGVPIEFLALFMTLLLLSINEGYQVAIISSREYTTAVLEKWPRARAIRHLIFSEDGEYDRLPRLFLGQSFMVVFCTYMISALTVLDKWPRGPWKILCASGLPGILIAVNLAQLLPSIWATKYPLQYLTKAPAVQGTVSAALFIESLGLLHFTFLVVSFLEWVSVPTQLRQKQGGGVFGSHPSKFTTTAGEEEEVEEIVEEDDLQVSITFKKTNSEHADDGTDARAAGAGAVNEAQQEDSNTRRKFKAKIFFSSLIQCACVLYILRNIFSGRSIVPLHPIALIAIILVVYYVVFLCEGLKIAIVSMAHLSRDELQAKGQNADVHDILTQGATKWLTRPRSSFGGACTSFLAKREGRNDAKAVSIEETTFSPAEIEGVHHVDADSKEEGVDVSRFLLGRQMIVVPANFLIASIFTFNLAKMGPFWTTICVNLALPSVICTLHFVQLAPQVLAGKYPGVFLTLPGAKFMVLTALAVENLGLAEIAFMLSDYLRPEATLGELLCPFKVSIQDWWYGIGVETPAPYDGERDERVSRVPNGLEIPSSTSSGSGALYVGSPNVSQRTGSPDVSQRTGHETDGYVAVENPVRIAI